MNSSVFVPGHITGFFSIENHEISLKNGSCGVGFLLSKGVKTIISPADKLTVDVNQGDRTVIDQVLDILQVDTNFKITQDIGLPIAAGFGTSAASALSMTLALNEFLNLGYSKELCGQIAHMAEINLGSGLGDVIAQTGRGLVLRTQPGAPGIGEIKSFEHDAFVAYKTFGKIETSEVIRDDHFRNLISMSGLKYVEMFKKEPTLENFLSFSNSFSREIDLMSDEVEDLIKHFNSSSDILGSSMAMLGNTAFAFAHDEEAFKDLAIKDLHICKLNNKGIVYD